MSALDKEFYIEGHPGYKQFMDLVKKGCPRCGNRLMQRGVWPIGLVHCDNVHECAMEFQYDDNGNWVVGPDGKPGHLEERFRFLNETEEFYRMRKEKAVAKT